MCIDIIFNLYFFLLFNSTLFSKINLYYFRIGEGNHTNCGVKWQKVTNQTYYFLSTLTVGGLMRLTVHQEKIIFP